jgi:hypothetical protein
MMGHLDAFAEVETDNEFYTKMLDEIVNLFEE